MYYSWAPILGSIELRGQSQQTQQRAESKSIYLAKPEVRGAKDEEVAGLGRGCGGPPFNISDLIRIVAVGVNVRRVVVCVCGRGGGGGS